MGCKGGTPFGILPKRNVLSQALLVQRIPFFVEGGVVSSLKSCVKKEALRRALQKEFSRF